MYVLCYMICMPCIIIVSFCKIMGTNASFILSFFVNVNPFNISLLVYFEITHIVYSAGTRLENSVDQSTTNLQGSGGEVQTPPKHDTSQYQ